MADKDSHIVQFDPEKVPEQLQSFIPLMQRWSIDDEGVLMDTVDDAPLEQIYELIEQMNNDFPASMEDWISKPDISDIDYSDEWLAFQRLITSYDYAKLRLSWEEHD